MSTKKLSRTVIEGGRAGWNKYERHYSHAETRAEERDYLKQVMSDLEAADEADIEPTRPIQKEFTDKLAPMERWIKAQVGRPWDQVRSEIFTKFDTRTTAGRHITFDHLLREVVETESGFDKHGNMADPNINVIPNNSTGYRRWSYANYYVDRSGILQESPDRYTKIRYRYQRISEQEFKNVGTWLAGRIIGEKDGKLHWFVPTQSIWKASWLGPNQTLFNTYGSHILVYYVQNTGPHKVYNNVPYYYMSGFYTQTHTDSGPYWEEIENPFSFRRRGELSKKEIAEFKSFKERLQQQILEFGKGR